MTKINIGCGITPISGWNNYDNSLSVRLSKYNILVNLLLKFKIISIEQFEFIKFCKDNQIFWADATKLIPESTNSASIIYSSHMFEHLDRHEANKFLSEVYRVLKPGGILRLVVPDLKYAIKKYLLNNDADLFIESTLLCVDNPRSFIERIKFILVGNRHHHWMYDGKSLSDKLHSNGFDSVKIKKIGKTSILDYGNLDLFEGGVESIVVEAKKV